jgi:hypothetical protein
MTWKSSNIKGWLKLVYRQSKNQINVRPFALLVFAYGLHAQSFFCSFFVQSGVLAQIVPRFEYSDTSIIDLPKDQNIKFGYLVVFEDRTRPGGKTCVFLFLF